MPSLPQTVASGVFVKVRETRSVDIGGLVEEGGKGVSGKDGVGVRKVGEDSIGTARC